MRWLRSAVSRFLLYTAVALLVAVAFGALYGVELGTSYNATVPSAEVGAAVAVIMPTSSSGVATVNVEGASQVLYLSLGTNPIQLLPEVRGLGLKITTMQVTTDLRAGVVIEVAGLSYMELAASLSGVFLPAVTTSLTITSETRSGTDLLVMYYGRITIIYTLLHPAVYPSASTCTARAAPTRSARRKSSIRGRPPQGGPSTRIAQTSRQKAVDPDEPAERS